MQYFAVSVFSWMLFHTINMYLMFVKVWNSKQISIGKGCLIGWGLPALVVTVSISVHFGLVNYSSDGANDDERMYPIYRETAM